VLHFKNLLTEDVHPTPIDPNINPRAAAAVDWAGE
jgi:hypothetical protein